ncbi:MAG: sigma-70 family RNA polymerase sigma factor [Prevotellaceae bacterium]|nr:sigma-70 family RNA polymerase sigma factor [Prevotellaceae bacterium]
MTPHEHEFEQCVNAYKGTIYTVCYMFSNDSDEVADLFQETLINLWKGFTGFEGRSDMKTWIYRVALNTCITADRREKRRHKRIGRQPEGLDADFNLFEDTDRDTQQIDLLHRRISLLRPFDRAIVLLWLENLPYDEIGKIVGLSAKAISVRLFRIRRQLRDMSNE